jgi:serine/threonine kinase 38
MFVAFTQLFFWVDYPYKEINPGNMLLDKNGHMQLSDLCLCKPIDCSKLSTLNENDHDH